MHKSIIQNFIHDMSSDVNVVRLTFMTTFFHSMIVILLLILNTNKLLVQHYENGLYIGKIAEFLIQDINKNHVVTWVIIITVFLFVLYSFVYPIGQAAIIHYLHWKKSIRHSLKASLEFFFPMYEFGFISLIFSPVSYFITAYKVFLLDGNTNTWIIMLFVFWFAFMVFANTLKVYTRYFIVLQQMPLYEALKAAIKTSLMSFKETYKYIRLQTWLLINFSINVLLVFGIPIMLIYGAISWGIINIWRVKTLVYIIFFMLVILGAYMSSFIRAFFVYYRYEKYKIIKSLHDK